MCIPKVHLFVCISNFYQHFHQVQLIHDFDSRNGPIYAHTSNVWNSNCCFGNSIYLCNKHTARRVTFLTVDNNLLLFFLFSRDYISHLKFLYWEFLSILLIIYYYLYENKVERVIHLFNETKKQQPMRAIRLPALVYHPANSYFSLLKLHFHLHIFPKFCSKLSPNVFTIEGIDMVICVQWILGN